MVDLLICHSILGIVKEFEDLDTNDPNCVLLGDAEVGFTYETMNAAFRVLHETDDPLIITLGCGLVSVFSLF